ncbi:MAG TPA: methyltransferase domain-containing protein [Thermoleophilaceae bacterium]
MEAYDAAFAELYDRITTHKDYAAEVDALARLIGEPDGRILDVGCGTGTHAALLAERGYGITAIDQSQQMARRAAEKAPAVRVESGDVADLAEDGFAFAMSLFNVVNCLEDLDALVGFLEAIAARLAPGARLLVEAWNAVAVIAEPPTTVERTYEGGTIRRTVVPRPDFLHQRLELDYVIDAPAGSFTVTHRLLLFTPLEVAFALARAGFGEVRVLTALPELRPATAEDRMLAFTCRLAA